MVTQTKLDIMHQMRQSGTTLARVGSRFGITREGVRRLLTKHYGSTRVQDLLTATELARLSSCSYSYIAKLKRRGVIQPATVIGHGRTLWNSETIIAVIEYIDSHRCPVCRQPLSSDRQVYCSRQCYLEARRYKNQPEEARRRHNERVARWTAQHPERAKQIQQRKQRRYRAKKSSERYQTTQYVIRRKCSIPLGTVVRVLTADRGKLKVEWGEQIVELPFVYVKRIVKEAVATS
jgi:predicted nucleic acid-binding Zn ribbon protein